MLRKRHTCTQPSHANFLGSPDHLSTCSLAWLSLIQPISIERIELKWLAAINRLHARPFAPPAPPRKTSARAWAVSGSQTSRSLAAAACADVGFVLVPISPGHHRLTHIDSADSSTNRASSNRDVLSQLLTLCSNNSWLKYCRCETKIIPVVLNTPLRWLTSAEKNPVCYTSIPNVGHFTARNMTIWHIVFMWPRGPKLQFATN